MKTGHLNLKSKPTSSVLRQAGDGQFSIINLKWLFLFVLLFTLQWSAFAQTYSIDWYKIAGGGDTSTGGTYTVSSTIGQHDAGGPMTGGNRSCCSTGSSRPATGRLR
jgi:hypothetical protein